MKLPNMKEARLRTSKKVYINNFNVDDSLKDIGKNKKYYIKTYG